MIGSLDGAAAPPWPAEISGEMSCNTIVATYAR
jgi:hypothetical protein